MKSYVSGTTIDPFLSLLFTCSFISCIHV